MSSDQARPIREVIGQRVQDQRIAAGFARDELARRARKYGLPWTQAIVANIEGGRRDLTLDELIALGIILGVNVPTLLAPNVDRRGHAQGDEAVLLSPTMRMSMGTATDILSNRNLAMPRLTPVPVAFPDEHRWPWPDASRNKRTDAAQCAGLEAEQKAARKLGVSPYALSLAALKVWGDCLSNERDRRVALEGAPNSPGEQSARRGHVTRALIEELRPHLTREDQ